MDKPNTLSQQMILTSVPWDVILKSLAELIQDKLDEFAKKEYNERLLSPAETCKLFEPAISLPTLKSWTAQGLLQSYNFGNRVYYKCAEVLEAGKNLKRYKTKIPTVSSLN